MRAAGKAAVFSSFAGSGVLRGKARPHLFFGGKLNMMNWRTNQVSEKRQAKKPGLLLKTAVVAALLFSTAAVSMAADPAVTAGKGSGSIVISAGTATADGSNAIAIGTNARAPGANSTVIGNGANTISSYSTVVGSGASVTGQNGSAFGDGSSAVSWATALGNSANASGRGAIAVGNGASASGIDSLATNIHSSAKGDHSIAIGYASKTDASFTSSVGPYASTSGYCATALGAVSEASGADSTALGRAANASVESGVAIGSYSKADREGGSSIGYDPVTGTNSTETSETWQGVLGAASIGSARRGTRQLTYVAAGEKDTDAVNVAQLKNLRTYATYTEGNGITITDQADGSHQVAVKKDVLDQIDTNKNNIAINTTNIAQNAQDIRSLNREVRKVGAGAAALAGLHPVDFDPDSKWNVAVSGGSYKDQQALALGAFYHPNDDTLLSLGTTVGYNDNMVTIGASFKVGERGNVKKVYPREAAKELTSLKKHVAEQDKKLASQDQRIGQLETMLKEQKEINEKQQQIIAKLAAKVGV